jgi:hypothetical protein
MALGQPARASIRPGDPHIKRVNCNQDGSMSQPLIVSIPHRLGRDEAMRRIKSGLNTARSNYSTLVTIHEETWAGERLAINVSALGQNAHGFIDVAEDHVRLEVTLPWLLAKIAEKFTPAIRKEATLMLEKK